MVTWRHTERKLPIVGCHYRDVKHRNRRAKVIDIDNNAQGTMMKQVEFKIYDEKNRHVGSGKLGLGLFRKQYK